MNRNACIKQLCRASAAIVIAMALLAFALLPQPARADWRSLSGGFLPAFASEPSFVISPDSRMVAFVTDKDTDDIHELYAMPITGTTPIKLNPPLVTGGDVNTGRFQFTPDGQYVIYLADQEVDNRAELFRVPVGGGQAAKLNPFLTTEGNMVNFRIDPDSGRVVYLADQETDDVFELWSVPITGGGSVKLSGTMVSGGDVGYFEFERWTRRVVFNADRETDEKFELYSVPIAGGAPAKLNPPIVAGGAETGIHAFAVNPVIPAVVFIARIVGAPSKRLYMIAVGDNIPPTPLSFALAQNQQILGFGISPTGDRVVYNVGYSLSSASPNKGTLYSVSIGGGDSTLLTDFPDPEYGVYFYDFRFTPDGARVVYTFQKGAASRPYLASSMHSGAWTTLYQPNASGQTFFNFNISPNGQWMWFQTDNGSSPKHLYTIPPGGGNPTDHGPADFAGMLPDSSRAVYTRYISVTTGANDLFSAQVSGGDERNLSGLNGAGFASRAQLSKDGKWIVFQANVNGRNDLRVSDGNPAQPPTPTPTPSPTPPGMPTPMPTPGERKVFLSVVIK